MNLMDRLDPELVPALEQFMEVTGGGFDLNDIPAMRAMIDAMIASIKVDVPAIGGVETEDVSVPGPDGAPDVAIRIYRPVDRHETLPALLWLHGGGYVLGGIELDDLMARQLAKDVNAIIVSVEYRLAPENPFPAPMEDCYAALKWLFANAAAQRIDASRIAVGGASAGGGMAAGLALMARDRGELKPAFQLLIYPALNDRNSAPASDSVADSLWWTRANNLHAWSAYLGAAPGGADVSEYAAPSRATDLQGLPPAHISVGEIDLFCADNIEYAQRLNDAGIATSLHVYPGACHAIDVFAPMSALSQRLVSERNDVIRQALQTE